VACALQGVTPRTNRGSRSRLRRMENAREPDMAQENVERILGRILTDAAFRQRFFAHTRDQLLRLDLLEHERDSLSKLDRHVVEILSEKLDPRIVRG
jgi:hypothetical protein